MTYTHGINLSEYKDERDLILDGYKKQDVKYRTDDAIRKDIIKEFTKKGLFSLLTKEQSENFIKNMNEIQLSFETDPVL